ncbi:MAG: intradiol ring-cleavage dioxygenase [Cyclobacteriaceae bacterium]|nr:intradiol ring-cleavage dioxygenase [Cyclobacteriaceae bacterium]
MKTLCLASAFLLLSITSGAQKSLGPCEDCDLLFQGMPATIGSSVRMAGPEESGEPLRIQGIIYQPDGKTPAPGIILYVYQTDHTGRYTPGPSQVHARRHGHLRGWMRSDERGRYEFLTIRPASYPNTRNPQHIHPIIVEPSAGRHYWIDDFLFDDDPLLSPEEKRRQPKRGGSGILTLTKGPGGEWIGKRDIVLGLNVPNYSIR